VKTLAVLLALAASAVCLPSLRAETAANVDDSTVVTAADGVHSRVPVPGVGEVRLTGPASVRVGHAAGVATVTLLGGDAEFAFEGGNVRVAVERGNLRVSGVNGRSTTLARGTEIRIDGPAAGPRVTVETGSALFTGDFEYILLRAHDSREFGPRRGDARSLVLSAQDVDLQMPTEVLLENRPVDTPALQAMAAGWDRGRESPRIP
jgi:hypothetical protein